MEPQQAPGGRGLSHVRIFVVDQCKLAAPLFKRHLQKQLTAYQRALTDCGSGLLANWLQAGTQVTHRSGSIGRHSEILRAAEKLGRRDPPHASRWRSAAVCSESPADPKVAALVPLQFCCVVRWFPLQCAIQSASQPAASTSPSSSH